MKIIATSPNLSYLEDKEGAAVDKLYESFNSPINVIEVMKLRGLSDLKYNVFHRYGKMYIKVTTMTMSGVKKTILFGED